MRKNKKSMYEIFWNTMPKDSFNSLSELLDNILDVFKAIDKDFSDTFKPYKAFYAVKRDILQPLFGLKNIFLGLLAIPAIPLMFVWDTIRLIPWIVNEDNEDLPNGWKRLQIGLYFFGANLAKSFLQVGYSIASILQGVTQVITAPLTWLFKIPLRFLITPAGGSKIEENTGFKRELAKTRDTYMLQTVQCYELHRKYKKQAERGQASNIDIQDEAAAYAKVTNLTSHLEFSFKDGVVYAVGHKRIEVITEKQTDDAKKATLAYLSLFRKKQPLPSAETLGQESRNSAAPNR